METLKAKLTLAAYLIVLLLAVVFILVGMNLDDTPQAILINLGSEFIGVFLIFLLINRFLGLESNNEVIEKLDQIDHKMTSLPSTIYYDELASMSEIISRMKVFEKVDAIGFSLANFIKDYQNTIIERVAKGANARFIIVDPNSGAGKLLKSDKPGFAEASQRGLGLLLGLLEKIQTYPKSKQKHGTFDYVSVKIIPHASVIIIDPHKDDGLIRLVFSGFSYSGEGGAGRVCLMISKREYPRWFDFYVKEFEQLWNKEKQKNQ